MQGVKYGEMLKSARMFTRLGEGVANVNTSTATSPFTSNGASASGPGSTLGSYSVPSTVDVSAGPESINLDDIAPESIFDGTSFEDFMGGFGNVDVMAN